MVVGSAAEAMRRKRTIGRASHGEVEGRQIVPEFIDLTGEKVHEPSRALLTLKEVFLGDALWHQRESVHLDTSKMNTESRVLLSFSWYGTEHSVIILKAAMRASSRQPLAPSVSTSALCRPPPLPRLDIVSAPSALALHRSPSPHMSSTTHRRHIDPLCLGSRVWSCH